jgi:transposase
MPAARSASILLRGSPLTCVLYQPTQGVTLRGIPESARIGFGLAEALAEAKQMGKPIAVTRRDFSPAELRGLAAHERDGAVVRRLLAIAMALEGASRADAAQRNGMDRQTLCDWVHRYNAEGVEGLRSRVSPGRPSTLSEAQMDELRIMVLEGPDPERNQVYRWRCADLRDEIAARWSVRLHERSVGRLLQRLAMTRLQPRPYHPKKDAAAQEAYKKISLAW